MSNKENRKEERRKFDRRKDERGTGDRRKIDRRHEEKEIIFEDQIEGRNAVIELLESEKDINKLYITKGEKTGSINKIISMAKEKRIIIVEKDRRQMEQMAQSDNYQGVIAVVPPYEYCEVQDILDYAKEKEENPVSLFIIRFIIC